jgi:hypothetical protein
LSAFSDEDFVVVDVLLELLVAGELELEAGVEALLLDELPDFEAAGLEVVVVVDELPVAGVAVAEERAGDTFVDGVAVPIGLIVAVAVGDAVAVAVAVGLAVAVGVAVAVAVAVAVGVAVAEAVAVGVAVANGVAVALAVGGAVGAVWPAMPDCVVTPVRPPPPRLMLMPGAGCTP